MEIRKSCPLKYGKVATLIALCLFKSAFLSAQIKEKTVAVSAETELLPLVKGWQEEYRKNNPEFEIRLTEGATDSHSGMRLSWSDAAAGQRPGQEIVIDVAQYALLPVVHVQNPLFEKELRKGIRKNQLKELFFNYQETEEETPQKKAESGYEIYAPVPGSAIAEAYAGFFGISSNELKGMYVAGSNIDRLSAMLLDTAGISFYPLPVVFDPETQKPVEGIKILPVDLNGNGKLDKNELIYDDPGRINEYLENTGNASIPALRISLTFNAELLEYPEMEKFIDWIRNDGRKINALLGYTNIDPAKPDELSRN